MDTKTNLTFPSGGFRRLKTFILGRVIYDVSVRFAELYIPKNSRTQDQMVQAARSGVQNIAEGSSASATSRETEIKLTGVARASLEELYLDYEDYLRQNRLFLWPENHPLRTDFIARKVGSNKAFRMFVEQATVSFPQMRKDEIVANAALLLINIVRYMLFRQIARQSRDFLDEGGLHERMKQMRRKNRGQ